MLTTIIFMLGLLLDGFISLYVNSTSYLQPLFTLTNIFLLYPNFKNKKNLYLIIISIIGIIYDLLYTNLLFFHAVIFYLFGILIIYIYKNYKQNFLTTIIYLVVIITSYEALTQLLLFVFQIIPFSLSKLIYKITHSLVINIIFAFMVKLLQKGIKSRRKA